MLRTLIAELRALSRWVYAGVFGLVLAGAFLYTHQDWRLYQKLFDQGVPVQGWVTEMDIVGGKRIDYAFRVDDKLYRGSSTAGFGNPFFSELRPGDNLTVFYLRTDPSVSAAGDPKERLAEQHRWEAWSIFLMVPAILFAIFAELERHG